MKKAIGIVLLFYGGIVCALPEFIALQERAQGQSLTGSHQLNDSLYSNPAASAFTAIYSLEGIYMLPKTFAVSVLDTKTGAIGGGLGYFRILNNEQEPLQGAKLALCGRLSSYMAIGIGAKLLWGPGVGGEHRNLKDLDAGLLANLGAFQLGLTTRNLFGGDLLLEQEREWAFGGRFGYNQMLFLSASAISRWTQFKPYQYGIGAEYVTPYYIAVKGGFRIQPDAHRSFWSLGASLSAQKVALHYVFEIPNQEGENKEHTLGLTLMF
ncbi:MAG: hypothetical protein HY537_08300 [Deltaproteobacteria bacterium]|nr:hypothetical protein [Deltaproteobacteria bacterium]